MFTARVTRVSFWTPVFKARVHVDTACIHGPCWKQAAQLSQRDRAAGWVSYGRKWKTSNGRQYFKDIIYLFNIKIVHEVQDRQRQNNRSVFNQTDRRTDRQKSHR